MQKRQDEQRKAPADPSQYMQAGSEIVNPFQIFICNADMQYRYPVKVPVHR